MNPLIDTFNLIKDKVPNHSLNQALYCQAFYNDGYRQDFANYLLMYYKEYFSLFDFEPKDYLKLYQEQKLDKEFMEKKIKSRYWSEAKYYGPYIIDNIDMLDQIGMCFLLPLITDDGKLMVSLIHRLNIIKGWSIQKIIDSSDKFPDDFVNSVPLSWLKYIKDENAIINRLSKNIPELIDFYDVEHINPMNEKLIDILINDKSFYKINDTLLFNYLFRIIYRGLFKKFRLAIEYYKIDRKLLKELYLESAKFSTITLNTNMIKELYDDDYNREISLKIETQYKRELIRGYILKKLLEKYD